MQKLREEIAFLRLNLSWMVLRWLAPLFRWRSAEPSLVLVPCDPWTVIGSRGDEAMVYAVLQNFRKRHPGGRITVLTGNATAAVSEDCRRMQRDFSLSYVHAWCPRFQIWNIVRAIRRVRATEVFVLGADCMDGHYSPYTSTILFSVADLACRLGLKVRLTGFSWNERPHPRAVSAAKKTTAALEILVRDPDSYDRIKSILPRARLVADTAFCLEPQLTDRVRAVLVQMENDHKDGNYVLGVNLNPMLKVDIAACVEALNAQSAISIYMIPHDYRDGGDLAELAKLDPLLNVPHRLLTETYSAAELKALTSGLDAILTSRMHLGIAALGMGKPVAGFAYQGKFAGLFNLFGLPHDWLMAPSDVHRLDSVLKDVVIRTVAVTEQVGQMLPDVLGKAKDNLLCYNVKCSGSSLCT